MSIQTPSKMCTGTTHIVGCNHGIQNANEDSLLPIDNIAEIRTQRLCFSRLLEATATSNEIQFVGEEWGLPQPSIAKLMSTERGIAWVDINTSLEDLDEMEIPRDYVHGGYSPAAKGRWNEAREKFMFRRVQEMKGSAQRLLVVCGFQHLQPMAQLLANSSARVQIVDYRNLSWYRADVFCDDD